MRFNGRATTDAQELAALVAADGSTGGFLKDSDFISGTWTPGITFATPGNLSVVYSTQAGSYRRLGSLVIANFHIQTSTYTPGTASSFLKLTGLPVASQTGAGNLGIGSLEFQGLTKANYTQFTVQPQGGSTEAFINAHAQGQTTSTVVVGDTTSGTQIFLRGTLVYLA